VLRRIFGPKRDEITGEWIKLHNEDLNDLYSSPSHHYCSGDKLIRMRWGERRGVYRLLVGKPEGKR